MGYLYVDPELVPSLPAPWAGYHSLEDGERGLEPALWPDARRLGTGFPAPHHVEWAHASLDVLEGEGFDRVYERGIAQADRLAELLSAQGVSVAPRGPTTLVSFEVPDPPAFAEQAATEGLVIRGIPGGQLARASVGAWNSGEEIERLVELAVASR
jgi:L-cysteine/cystine lyase